ncbi:hypothetical protein CCMA1212_003331 [Trichoderma ghanense]|uniref:Uncharacterized protein n=1 Tax=Trichoderma ghanense TaxID=65468 RepID=A0ABY2H9N8_9HYPO
MRDFLLEAAPAARGRHKHDFPGATTGWLVQAPRTEQGKATASGGEFVARDTVQTSSSGKARCRSSAAFVTCISSVPDATPRDLGYWAMAPIALTQSALALELAGLVQHRPQEQTRQVLSGVKVAAEKVLLPGLVRLFRSLPRLSKASRHPAKHQILREGCLTPGQHGSRATDTGQHVSHATATYLILHPGFLETMLQTSLEHLMELEVLSATSLAISCHLFAHDACFDLFVPVPVSRMRQGRTAGAADERMTLSPRDRRRRLLRQGCDSLCSFHLLSGLSRSSTGLDDVLRQWPPLSKTNPRSTGTGDFGCRGGTSSRLTEPVMASLSQLFSRFTLLPFPMVEFRLRTNYEHVHDDGEILESGISSFRPIELDTPRFEKQDWKKKGP